MVKVLARTPAASERAIRPDRAAALGAGSFLGR